MDAGRSKARGRRPVGSPRPQVLRSPKSPPPAKSPPPRQTTSVNSLTNSFSKMTTSNVTAKKTTSSVALRSKLVATKAVKKSTPEKKPIKTHPVDPSLMECRNCRRYFDPTRITLHQKICEKTTSKKRKPFDPVKHRLQGTEAEGYLKKPKQQTVTNSKGSKRGWREQHEEFVRIVRAAREAQAHVARGGKLSDLPPPPPLSTEQLTPCPHCARKFNRSAAERHIPKCANIRSRPKPLNKLSNHL